VGLTTYRYRQSGAVDQAALRAVVGSTVSLLPRGGRSYQDIQVDDSHVEDLDAALTTFGYERVTAAGTPQEQFDSESTIQQQYTRAVVTSDGRVVVGVGRRIVLLKDVPV
jgi:hypothetical protein